MDGCIGLVVILVNGMVLMFLVGIGFGFWWLGCKCVFKLILVFKMVLVWFRLWLYYWMVGVMVLVLILFSVIIGILFFVLDLIVGVFVVSLFVL